MNSKGKKKSGGKKPKSKLKPNSKETVLKYKNVDKTHAKSIKSIEIILSPQMEYVFDEDMGDWDYRDKKKHPKLYKLFQSKIKKNHNNIITKIGFTYKGTVTFKYNASKDHLHLILCTDVIEELKYAYNYDYMQKERTLQEFIELIKETYKNNYTQGWGDMTDSQTMVLVPAGKYDKYAYYFGQKLVDVKIHTQKVRPSPSESAKDFKLNTKRKGNDGNMWKIVENKNKVKKWQKLSLKAKK